MDRRKFLAGTLASASAARRLRGQTLSGKAALLGGPPVRKAAFPEWPVFDSTEEQALTGTLRSGKWGRGGGTKVEQFEKAYAKLMGAQGCLAAANGTSALLIALNALGIGPGDEVIVPPYTFVATINVILQVHALPVFVDTDPDTFQIDARKIEARITPRTAAIIPVHMGGYPANLETILAVAGKHNLPVIEDAAQAHMAEWGGRKVGTLGRLGCFSFQASKNLNSGEGGAILSNDGDLIEKCYAFHNNSRGRRGTGSDFSYREHGLNLRLTEFQAALLLAQMSRLEAQTDRRQENANYLTTLFKEIPGISPAKLYPKATRSAYHLYMFRYDAREFGNLPRAKFLKALAAEGIPASSGYSPLNREPFLKNTLESRGYQRIYPAAEIRGWMDANQCPANDRLCKEAVWFTQTMLLGPRSDMDDIARAIRKIKAQTDELARA